jgi:hypothetical protein
MRAGGSQSIYIAITFDSHLIKYLSAIQQIDKRSIKSFIKPSWTSFDYPFETTVKPEKYSSEYKSILHFTLTDSSKTLMIVLSFPVKY